MQAIRTKFYGPTNTRGSKIIAKAERGQVTVPYDHSLNADQNHEAACLALVAKLGWSGERVGGYFDGAYYWVGK